MSGPDPIALLWSVLTGVGLGLLFALFEAVRAAFRAGRLARFGTDLIFCLCAGAVTFLLALAIANGQLRFFQAGGELIGFLLTDCTAGYAARRFLPRLFSRWAAVRMRLERAWKGKTERFLRHRKEKRREKSKKSKKSAKRT